MTTASASNVTAIPSAEESGDGIWFGVPAGFTTVPLPALVTSAGAPEAERLGEALAPILDAAPDEVCRQEFVATLAAVQRMLHSLCTNGTAHCAVGLHRDDAEGTADPEGSFLLSLFTITWVDTAWAPRAVTAARVLLAAEGHTDIDFTEVPCGPVAFSETLRTAAAESVLPPQPLLQIHGYLPHPDGTAIALLTLSTTAVRRREQYRAILRQIAHTVTFEDPFATAAGGERS
ncbi:hypothetical protein [Streptomyces fuscichromogenes]|uniref:Uncharacterized protein n=1 Tax=Streptomyces fuscichromogenes TaxID=1324013 RepID=A0A917XJU0_9ACTN|nr:hypothetical protein [Streptomyces fuscichromogenes]GGN33323.1 hypothetical protein GCM10011578_073090 [Streptomyces fuscichromogenes]